MKGNALVGVLCALLSLAAAPSPAPQTGRQPQAPPLPGGCVDGELACYNRLVEAYASGDDERSVGRLLEWNPRVYPEIAKNCDKGRDKNDPWDARRYAAAVMMHTDAAFRLSREASTQEAFLHLDVATQHLARGRALDREGVREWARQWYFVVARCLRDRNAPYVAQHFLRFGRERQPQDPVVLAESGFLEESIATFYAIDSRRPLVHRGWGHGDIVNAQPMIEARTANLNDAVKWLRQAADIEPGSETTRLHLGRVLALRLEDEESLRALRGIAQASQVPTIAYLADLFSAAVQDRSGRLDEAAASYRAALSRWPAAHAAYFGLSEVLQRAGKGDESRQVLGTLLGQRFGPPDDPFWSYQFDDPDVADRRLEVLRSEVRR